MWPGFDSQTRRHMWVEFVGSLLCSERFSPGYSGFTLSSKTYIWLDWICVNFNLLYPQLVCLNTKQSWHLNKVSFLSFPLVKQLTFMSCLPVWGFLWLIKWPKLNFEFVKSSSYKKILWTLERIKIGKIKHGKEFIYCSQTFPDITSCS